MKIIIFTPVKFCSILHRRVFIMMQSWYDEFLSWDEEKYGGLHEVLVEKNEVWIPDLLVENT